MKMRTVAAIAAAGIAALGLPLIAPLVARAQDKPTVVKDKLPRKAVCFICAQNGEEHGEEKPAGAVAYKGKTYYFCNKKEIEAFVKDPEAFLPLPLPRPAPAAALKTLDGGAKSLSDWKGKVVLVDFWATWCAPCVKAMPDLQKLHEKFAGRGFSVVGVSIDEKGAEAVRPFLAKRKFTYPILLDGSGAWEKWGVRGIPALFIVNGDGQIVRQWTGAPGRKELEKAVEALLR